MLSTPEKDAFDHVLACSGARKRVVSHRPKDPMFHQVDHIDFETHHSPDLCRKEDRCYWARHGWSKFKPQMRDRLLRNVTKIFGLGYFDGMGSFKHILVNIVNECHQHVQHKLDQVPVYACCDMAPSRQTMLKNFDEEYRCKHLHRGVAERFPDDVQKAIKEMLPANDCWLEANRLANANIAHKLKTTYEERREECDASYCTLHDDMCPVYPRDGELPGRTVCVAAAGINCKDHSAIGGLDGDGGVGMVGHYSYTYEMLHRDVKLGITECTPRWSAEPMAEVLGVKFQVKDAVLDPPQIWDSYDRMRRDANLFLRDEVPCI